MNFSCLLPRLAALFLASSLAVPCVRAASQYDQRLANLSTRGQVGTGANIMITGFVVNDGAPKKVLIRAVGLSLARFNIAAGTTLQNPTLSLFNSNGELVLQNDNWGQTDTDLLATTTAAGAFTLGTATNNGANDAALVATLSPGAYTAQVSGVSNGIGIGLLEVYDITGSARLMNISTRAVVGAGNGVLISGLVVAPGGGSRSVLIRAAGPALTALGVPGAISNPVFSIYNDKGVIIAGGSNDNWGTQSAPATVASVSAAVAQAGAFPFPADSNDAALVINLAPGSYTIQVAGVGGVGGVALVEVYDLTSEVLSTVSVTASVATTDTQGAAPGIFTFTRVGNLSTAVNAAYTIAGTAVSGTDYQPLSGIVSFPSGVSTATVSLTPKANPANQNNRTATLTLVPNNSYGVGAGDNASVSIFYNAGTLYVSNLRTPGAVTGSTAYGTGTIQLSSDQKSALVNVGFSNLSSPEVIAHLSIDGNYVFTLPQGQVNNALWTFAAVGTYSTADLIAALKAGRVTISIDTSSNPAGELIGTYLKTSGSAAFNAPAAPPAFDLSKVSAPDASRFLTQATFGAKGEEILALAAKGYTAWINEQMALPATLHFAEANADFAANTNTGAPFGTNQNTGTNGPNTRVSQQNRLHAWWKGALTAPDQLRQRVAFALSEILVTSDQNSTIAAWEDGHTVYYDLLVNGAFGNFRQLLENVTLSPNMGIYLSSIRNVKSRLDAQGKALTFPDENYAREIMQLFTVGLNELQPDGTLKLDPTGLPIPTYTQDTIVQMAKIFTGWGFYQTAANPNIGGNNGSPSYINPMMFFPTSHDDTVKTIIGGKVLPAGQGGIGDLKDTLDALANHPTTAPFISKQLIQRLVTSNPSPGYVYRVSQVFANNGAGVRGDLGAVVRAILLDYEARSSAVINTTSYGKLKEPLLRATALLRAFNGGRDDGRFALGSTDAPFDQTAGGAITVFNFFAPGYVSPGSLAAAGLFAPEFQTLTDTTAITTPNYYYGLANATRSGTTVGLNYNSVLPLAKKPTELVEYMNLVLSAGSMPKAMTDRLIVALNALPTATSDVDRVRTAVYLTISSPEAAIQK